jgi:hypothetical protein
VERKLPVDKNDAYDADQLPILLTVASTADTAVGRYFPTARWLTALNFIGNAEVFARRSERIGMGRYEPHYTHRLTYQEPELPTSAQEERSG